MNKIQTYASGKWYAFFRYSNDLCRSWFPYKVIETFYDETSVVGIRVRQIPKNVL